MTKGPAAARGRDLRALARIVTDDRGELPAEGLAPSLLSDLVQLIGCDFLVFGGTDSGQQVDWFGQTVPAEADDPTFDDHAFWTHYWDSPCSHPERTGRTHLENIYRLLQVSSRTAAVTRAFADHQRTE